MASLQFNCRDKVVHNPLPPKKRKKKLKYGQWVYLLFFWFGFHALYFWRLMTSWIEGREQEGGGMKVKYLSFPLFENIKWEREKRNGEEHFTLIPPSPLFFIHPHNEGERREREDSSLPFPSIPSHNILPPLLPSLPPLYLNPNSVYLLPYQKRSKLSIKVSALICYNPRLKNLPTRGRGKF